MSFMVIDPKFLIIISNYPSYDGQNFWSYIQPISQVNYEGLGSQLYYSFSFPFINISTNA